MSNLEPNRCGDEIAIIGMAVRLPGAKNPEEFWDNLRSGVESVSFFSYEELIDSGVNPALLADSNYVRAHGYLEGSDLFDASFFGYTPREAEVTDPQHRIFLECAWEALENAGYASETARELTGVFAGAGTSTYWINLYRDPSLPQIATGFEAMIGNDKDYLATRVSYKLNLKGPSVNIQTACSTSLVAVHMACQSLLNGECHMALAGGISISSYQKAGYWYQEGGVASPDGHCRAFDADANGSVGGDGAGVVVLKPLERAIRDRDNILAVIKGTAINNDGNTKVGFTAPSVEGQTKVIRDALEMASVDPNTITYIETHGTGTPLGDTIELAALMKSFRSSTAKKESCAIGSVKTNIGHLNTAAGVIGLIKVTLALKNKEIPPSLNFNQPSPQIDLKTGPFYVNTTLREWKNDNLPLRAGVSAFGIGGTNAHVIVEEAPDLLNVTPETGQELILLSAKTENALKVMADNLVQYIERNKSTSLVDVAHSLQVGRKTFPCRLCLTCRNADEAIAKLNTLSDVYVHSAAPDALTPSVMFMFPGFGDQYVYMAAELYQIIPVFREIVDYCSNLLMAYMDVDIRSLLFPDQRNVSEAADSVQPDELDLRTMLQSARVRTAVTHEQIDQAQIAHPAIFVIEYALAQLFLQAGVRPQAMLGHSIGEYVAACIAGVFSLEDALRLVATRAQLIETLALGAMLVVPLTEQELLPYLVGSISLAAVNAPALCVVAGPADEVAQLEINLKDIGLASRFLSTTHAFHSVMMEPIQNAFLEVVRGIKLSIPKIPYVSNVTGTWITTHQAISPEYWAAHLSSPVRFLDGIRELCQDPNCILLEIGPGQTLANLARQCLSSYQENRPSPQLILSSLRHSYEHSSDMKFLLVALGKLWLSGIAINWLSLPGKQQCRRVPLPTYPFERQRYWIAREDGEEIARQPKLLQEQTKDIEQWFYTPSWKGSLLVSSQNHNRLPSIQSKWLVFLDDAGIGSHLINHLGVHEKFVVIVRPGKVFARLGEREYILDPSVKGHYCALVEQLLAHDCVPTTIVHLWNVTSSYAFEPDLTYIEKTQDSGFFSVLFLAQAFHLLDVTTDLTLYVLANHVYDVESADLLDPAKVTVLGILRVLQQEHRNIRCRAVDVSVPETEVGFRELSGTLLKEFSIDSTSPAIAIRKGRRWEQAYEPCKLPSINGSAVKLRQQGVYLITGGLGNIGFLLAEWIAKLVPVRLVLLGRSEIPSRQEWDSWLLSHDTTDRTRVKIERILSLEALGAEVMVATVDVSQASQVADLVQKVLQQFGTIDGVVHAAGTVEGYTAVIDTTLEDYATHFQSKVTGLWALNNALSTVEPDFCLMLSSISVILGGLGFAAYASANGFMDAFARSHGDRWISINWDHLGPQDTVEAMSRILFYRPSNQIIVSPLDLKKRLTSWVELEHSHTAVIQSDNDADTGFHERPKLKTNFLAPRNNIERRIASIWGDLLGIQDIGVQDNFYELGGHSLLGTRIISHLSQAFHVSVPIRLLLESPTVELLALHIETLLLTRVEEKR